MRLYLPVRVSPPGQVASYSNYATALAGLIVSHVSGVEFKAYIKQNIFDKLGMYQSTFIEPPPRKLEAHRARGYSYSEGRYKEGSFEVLGNFSPAGALSTTASDLMIFAQAILNGGELNGKRIIQKKTLQRMFDESEAYDPRLPPLTLGFKNIEHRGIQFIGHDGDLTYFHSRFMIDRENDFAIFASFGARGGMTIRGTILESLYDAFWPAQTPSSLPTPPADFASRAERFTGSYQYWRAQFSTYEKTFLATPGTRVSATNNNSLLINETEFVEIGNNLFQAVTGYGSNSGK